MASRTNPLAWSTTNGKTCECQVGEQSTLERATLSRDHVDTYSRLDIDAPGRMCYLLMVSVVSSMEGVT